LMYRETPVTISLRLTHTAHTLARVLLLTQTQSAITAMQCVSFFGFYYLFSHHNSRAILSKELLKRETLKQLKIHSEDAGS
jgi:hypothetical protein